MSSKTKAHEFLRTTSTNHPGKNRTIKAHHRVRDRSKWKRLSHKFDRMASRSEIIAAWREACETPPVEAVLWEIDQPYVRKEVASLLYSEGGKTVDHTYLRSWAVSGVVLFGECDADMVELDVDDVEAPETTEEYDDADLFFDDEEESSEVESETFAWIAPQLDATADDFEPINPDEVDFA